MVCQDEHLSNYNVSRMLQHAFWLVLPVASTSPQFFGSYTGFLSYPSREIQYRGKFKILILTFN